MGNVILGVKPSATIRDWLVVFIIFQYSGFPTLCRSYNVIIYQWFKSFTMRLLIG